MSSGRKCAKTKNRVKVNLVPLGNDIPVAFHYFETFHLRLLVGVNTTWRRPLSWRPTPCFQTGLGDPQVNEFEQVGGGPQVKKFEQVWGGQSWGWGSQVNKCGPWGFHVTYRMGLPQCEQTDRQTPMKTLPSHKPYTYEGCKNSVWLPWGDGLNTGICNWRDPLLRVIFSAKCQIRRP